MTHGRCRVSTWAESRISVISAKTATATQSLPSNKTGDGNGRFVETLEKDRANEGLGKQGRTLSLDDAINGVDIERLPPLAYKGTHSVAWRTVDKLGLARTDPTDQVVVARRGSWCRCRWRRG